jgi:hypothetical protein
LPIVVSLFFQRTSGGILSYQKLPPESSATIPFRYLFKDHHRYTINNRVSKTPQRKVKSWQINFAEQFVKINYE